MPVLSWNLTLSQLAIYFEGRLNKVMTLQYGEDHIWLARVQNGI